MNIYKRHFSWNFISNFTWFLLKQSLVFLKAEQSLMTFEGEQRQGAVKIMEKFASLTFQSIQHLITAVDCQPTFDGGILINVLGQLKVNIVKSFTFLDQN